jgi:hypothetical protein
MLYIDPLWYDRQEEEKVEVSGNGYASSAMIAKKFLLIDLAFLVEGQTRLSLLV